MKKLFPCLILSLTVILLLDPIGLNAQKKQHYCNKDSIVKWMREGRLEGLDLTGPPSMVFLKNGVTYEDTSYFPPSVRLKRSGTVPMVTHKYDTIPCAIYVIKGDSSEPNCIAAMKVNCYSTIYTCNNYVDKLTGKEYHGGGNSYGENIDRFDGVVKYLAWDKTEFTKDIHLIKEKELH